jgi:hypothetical protein
MTLPLTPDGRHVSVTVMIASTSTRRFSFRPRQSAPGRDVDVQVT